MPAPTRRSKAERDLYKKDNTLPRTPTNIATTIKIEPPERIAEIPEKLQAWNYITGDLASRQLLSTSYIIDITMLVDNLYDYEFYRKTLEDSGPLVPIISKDGESVIRYEKNPLFDMVKNTEKIVMKLCEKFGLNPRDAVYVTNPDIKTQPIEVSDKTERKKVEYFST